MSANIFINTLTGKHSAMIRGAAWHNFGQRTFEAKNWAEAQELAQMDRKVVKQQLQFNGETVPAWGLFHEDLLYVDPLKAFITQTTESFEPMQYDYMFAFLDTMVESEGAHYESAGILNGGKQAWALVNLHEAFEPVPDDHHESYLVFTEDRTQRSRARVFMTTVRVVCANTFESSLRSGEGKDFIGFKHTGNLTARLEEAAQAFTGARMGIKTLKEKLGRLAERRIDSSDTLKNVLTRLFPSQDTPAGQVSAAMEKKMLDVIKLFESNDHDTFPEIRGTAYNLKNAIDEYIDHFSGVRRTLGQAGKTDDEIRSERAMFGDGAALKETALQVILEETANAPLHSTRRVYSTPAQTKAAREFAAGIDDGSLLGQVIANTDSPN